MIHLILKSTIRIKKHFSFSDCNKLYSWYSFDFVIVIAFIFYCPFAYISDKSNLNSPTTGTHNFKKKTIFLALIQNEINSGFRCQKNYFSFVNVLSRKVFVALKKEDHSFVEPLCPNDACNICIGYWYPAAIQFIFLLLVFSSFRKCLQVTSVHLKWMPKHRFKRCSTEKRFLSAVNLNVLVFQAVWILPTGFLSLKSTNFPTLVTWYGLQINEF